jgi:hypothetical protein
MRRRNKRTVGVSFSRGEGQRGPEGEIQGLGSRGKTQEMKGTEARGNRAIGTRQAARNQKREKSDQEVGTRGKREEFGEIQ